MTSFRVGSASDVGQLRTNNQDSKLIADAVSVFAVADGMGGHQGGEVASAIAVETLEAVISEPTTASVVEAVKEANRRIFSRAADTTELRGMGTTLVAIALVNQDGADEEIAWVNVGDSRVYLLRDDELHQLSRDHSLVEDLRRGGQLSEEEAAIHPQRNILTRALGIDEEVEVDSDSLLPLTGDRFLLCSDGLFNEVDPTTLVDTLTSGEDPDAVAHELVRLANAGGGRDNITCVVVDVADDGGGAARAAEAGAGAPAVAGVAGATDATVVDQRLVDAAGPGPEGASPVTAEMPAVPGGGGARPAGDQDPTPPAGVPVAPAPTHSDEAGSPPPTDDGVVPPSSATEPAGTAPPPPGGDTSPFSGEPKRDGDEDLPFGRTTTDLYGDMDHVGGRHRAVTALIAVVVLTAVLGGAYLAAAWYAERGYYVAAAGDEVQIYKGQSGGFLIFDPSLEEASEVPLDEFSRTEQEQIRAEPEFDSLADAQSFVRSREARVAQRKTEESTTTTADPTTTVDPDEPDASTTTGAPDATASSAPTTTEGP